MVVTAATIIPMGDGDRVGAEFPTDSTRMTAATEAGMWLCSVVIGACPVN